MVQLRLILVLISLSLTRFALASASENLGLSLASASNETQSTRTEEIKQIPGQNEKSINYQVPKIEDENSTKSNTLQPEVPQAAHNKTLRQSSRKRQKSIFNGQSTNWILRTLVNLVENYDRQIDMKQLLAHSIQQLRLGKFDLNSLLEPISSGIKARSSVSTNSKQQQASSIINIHQANETNKTNKSKLNDSSILAEGGNLLSITNQLVKLARAGFVGGEFTPSGQIISQPSASLLAPLIGVPTMLGAASHVLQSSADHSKEHEDHYYHAVGKSDWFWVIMPAIIAVGAGVIIVPLIAAWLVSSAMGQSTMTVAAGRRRRKRDTAEQLLDPLSMENIHSGLLGMLDIHKLMDAPELVIGKLSRLHEAFESIGKNFIQPHIKKHN